MIYTVVFTATLSPPAAADDDDDDDDGCDEVTISSEDDVIGSSHDFAPFSTRNNNNKFAQSKLGRVPRRCESKSPLVTIAVSYTHLTLPTILRV